jgi:hypothetical protein
MKIKKEYVILAALILVLALYLYFHEEQRTLYELPVLPEVPAKDISKIEIEKADGKITLKKKGDAWFIDPQDYPVDSDRIKGINTALEKLSLTAMVSEAKNYTRYDLSPDKRIRVSAWTGDTLARKFEIGKAVPSSRHTFVRLPGDDRIYHARDDFRNKFDRTAGEFRDKTVLAFDTTAIQEIHLTRDQQVLIFKRTQAPLEKNAAGDKDQTPLKAEMIWQSQDGRKGDQTRLNRFLNSLSNLSCDSYIDDRRKEGFTRPSYSITLKGDRDYTLKIFPKLKEDDDDYPAVSSETKYPFLLPDWKAKDIMPDFDEVVESPKKSQNS